jgi:arylsulfatase/uncharacterized sulfatase
MMIAGAQSVLKRIFVSIACLATALDPSLSALAQEASSDAPNFVVILIDDAAFMDLGVYGGEARTPNIDALAAAGAMFTNYRTSPLCAPSRAMLLTGVDNHRTGVATIPEVLPPEHAGKPGYSMSLEPGVLTIADRLGPMGYRTFMTGKWHLGSRERDLPNAHGFERSFALDASGADNWEDKSYMPFYADAPWYEDGVAAELPEDFYSSEFIVDRMIDYLDQDAAQAPFLAYLAFQAVHIPVQAPANFTANYDGVYDAGWDAMQKARWQRAKELGFVPQGSSQPALHPSLRTWDHVSQAQQALFAARMQVNAGMLEVMDHHIGRFITYLKATGQYQNTIFVITSDNGPEPSDADDPRMDLWLGMNGYQRGIENIGEKGSYVFIGPEFASAAASPNYLFKFYASEGGLRVPLIMSGPGIAPGNEINAMSIVTDITPTLLDFAGAPDAPTGSVSIDGRSLVGVLTGAAAAVYGPGEVIGIEVSGNSALYRGDYKVVRNQPPIGDGHWRLFNLANDPGETRDLSAENPELLADLLDDYDAYAERNGVLETPPGYNSVRQVEVNMVKALASRNWGKLMAAALILLLALTLMVRQIVQRIRRRAV